MKATKNMTTDEKQSLAGLEHKFNQIRDSVGNVISGHRTGFFLCGEGGTGKSFAVLDHLRKEKVQYQHHQGRVTARGLYDALKTSPSGIHLIEDAESMYTDKLWTGVLRSALWSQDHSLHSTRRVTWITGRGAMDFSFTGGIIIISNVRMSNTKGDMRAVLSRVPEVYISFTTDELLAKQKEIALKGYSKPGSNVKLSTTECLEVLGFIKDNRRALKLNVDFRILINAFDEYHSDKSKKNLTTWRDRIYSAMCQEIKPVSDSSWL